MTPLTAGQALSPDVICVSSDDRPSVEDVSGPWAPVFAVFEEAEGTDPTLPPKFLGLVAARQVALYPRRIFADLLPPCPDEPVERATPLEILHQRLAQESAEGIAVMDQAGRFLGVVTRASLLAATLGYQQQVSEALQQSLETQQQQCRLVAFEIHDGLVQYATAARMHLQAFGQLQPDLNSEAEVQLERSLSLLDETIAEARRLLNGLHPPKLQEQGVIAALETLIEQMEQRGGPEIELHARPLERLPAPLEIAVYRIVQEGLTNALRHSGSTRVLVKLKRRRDCLRLQLRDWGKGFPSGGPPRTGHGLRGIRERVRLLKGRVTIGNAPGPGAQILVELPLSLQLRSKSASLTTGSDTEMWTETKAPT